MEGNSDHKLHLEGHDHAVRALAARGRTLVSGSYDCTVRIWDIITGACKWVLTGHTQKGQIPSTRDIFIMLIVHEQFTALFWILFANRPVLAPWTAPFACGP